VRWRVSGFDSARAAFEAPPDDAEGLYVRCDNCDGEGSVSAECDCDVEVCDCPSTETCTKCEGEGTVFGPDLTDWCDKCGLTGKCPDCDPPGPHDEE
jgi:hypothetical protein